MSYCLSSIKSHIFRNTLSMSACLGLLILLNPIVPHAATSIPTKPIVMIGTMTFNMPFETSDPEQHVFTGFEIDIMNAVCRRMNVTCQYKAAPNLIDVFALLSQGKIDLAVGSIIIFRGDAEHVFSTPYLLSGIQFFAKKNSKLTTVSDATMNRIGTTDDPMIKTLVTVNYAKAYPLKIYETPQAGIDALTAGKIDVFVMQTPITKYWLSITGDAFKLIGESIPIGLGNGVMAMSDAVDLMDNVNQALRSMERDGTYAQIYNRYNF